MLQLARSASTASRVQLPNLSIRVSVLRRQNLRKLQSLGVSLHLRSSPPQPTHSTAAAAKQLNSSMGSLGPSLLVAFDFDHTIVDGNTDTRVVKASPSGRLPEEVKGSYQPGRWTEYMQRVLSHLHDQGVSAADMQQVMQQLPYTQGMGQLLQELQGGSIAGQPCSCIILSDSNSEFIDWILTSRGHRDIFSHIYTNPCTLSPQGQLLVSPHHSHECKACPVNMCKRQILQLHRSSHPAGAAATRVLYVGDGGNDLCPAQSLGPEDVVFVRAGYALEKLLQDPEVQATVTARVHVWSDAAELPAFLKGL